MRLPPGLSRLKDGRWRVRATATDPKTGKIREVQRTLPAKTTKEDAVRALFDIKEEIRSGNRERRTEPTSLTSFATQWLEDRSARLRRTVVDRDRWALERILPHLGDIHLEMLDRTDIRRFVTELETMRRADGAPYSSESVSTLWRVLRALLTDAVREHDLERDPLAGVRGPSVRRAARRERRTLSADELGALLGAAQQVVPDRYTEILMLALTGMRAGELFALEWQDIDFAARLIRIRRSVHRGTVTPTKTGDPREAALPAVLATVLTGMAPPDALGSTNVVFLSTEGTHRTPASLHKPLARAAKAAGISQRVTPQVLRRTFNTLLVLQGADRLVLRAQMGHVSEEMTARYAGIPIAAKLDAVSRLVGHLGPDLGLGSQPATNVATRETKKPPIPGACSVAAARIELATSSV